MIREITLGQYYQADSVIHRLDPRVKLVGTILYIVSLFLFKKAAPYVLAVIFLAAVISLSKVPFSYMVRGLKAIMILLLITAAFNIFLTSGEPLAKVWIFTITREGVKCCVYCDPSGASDHRILSYDTDNDPKSADRCHGKADASTDKDQSTGA